MSDISKIKLPNGDVYNLKDNNALHNDDAYVQDVQINNTSIINNGIANIPRATGADYGVAKMATDSVVKAGTDYYSFLTPMRNHISTFYGLAKAAGDTTQVNSSNAIGTYTTEAKTAIQTMLNVPDTSKVVSDVQIKGTSIKSSGVANIPEMSETVAGVVKRGSGLYINSSGQLCSNIGVASTIKQGTAPYAIAPISLQGNTVFYGLAAAAGDTTQSTSSNTVGTYTNEAKSAIQAMLGVGTMDETITSTTPTINAVANHRYKCGEISLLDFTPCTYGICEVMFTSGSTPTVLTLPNTVKMPEWFELESNRIYDIIITDGTYGAVTSWAV